jgi:hypothetical protein
MQSMVNHTAAFCINRSSLDMRLEYQPELQYWSTNASGPCQDEQHENQMADASLSAANC